MSEESVNSRRCKGGNLFFSRILFCICLCGPVAYALAEESTVVSEIRQNEKKSISGVVTDTNYKPQNKMFHFCKTFCSKITLVNTIQNVI